MPIEPSHACPRVLAPAALSGMSCFVTGAGSGIGRAIALRLAGLGAQVFGTGRRPEKLAETATEVAAAGGSFRFEPCNVRDTAAIDDLVRRVGEQHGIDGLVHSAGGQFFAPVERISRRGWDAVVDLNLSAVFTVTKAAHPFLRARGGGSVVAISLSGVERGSMGIAHSIAARAGVLGLFRTLALEWAGAGVRLNCVGPGTVLTPGLAAEGNESALRKLIDATPMKRDTSAAEVAELVGFLLSPAARMITGQLLQIDGGAHLGPGLHMSE